MRTRIALSIGLALGLASGSLLPDVVPVGVAHSQAGAPGKGAVLTVRVMQAKVMKKPQFIGATSGTVSRGDRVTFVRATGAWYEVTGPASGWLHKTNVIAGEVSLSSKPGAASARGEVSRDEVELAGRGFTPEVESQYRQKNPNLDFHHIDAIEHVPFDPSDLEAFVHAGRLAGSDGGKS